MKKSTKGRYSLCMLKGFAGHQNDGFVSLKDVSKRRGIFIKYLVLVVTLRKLF